jgi:hypothetical protein
MPETKGKSPFYPGQPVPPELFTGRVTQLRRIKARGVDQVAAGKPVSMFVQGESGIGKSSVANFIRATAEKESGLHGIYVTLGRASSLEDVAAAILEGVVKSGSSVPQRVEAIRGWLSKYIKQAQLFGVTLNTDAMRKDASSIVTPAGLLGLLTETVKRLSGTGVRGIMLILDEINGISANPLFAHFLKDLIETNAANQPALPLLLMICGAEARRNDLIRNHPPVGRIFDVVAIDPMDDKEVRDFFKRAFESVHVEVSADAMDLLVFYSGGLPKIMHEIGDAAYYSDDDSRIDSADAFIAVGQAADEVGRKYVEPQVVDALKSRAYHSILEKVARLGKQTFTRDELADDLTPDEAKKLDHFLKRLKRLNVIRAGEVLGEYVFNVRLYQVYLSLKTIKKQPDRGDEPRHG